MCVYNFVLGIDWTVIKMSQSKKKNSVLTLLGTLSERMQQYLICERIIVSFQWISWSSLQNLSEWFALTDAILEFSSLTGRTSKHITGGEDYERKMN